MESTKHHDFILFAENINQIGGVETALYLMVKNLVANHYSVMVLYKTCDRLQFARLRDAGVAVAKYSRYSEYLCDVAVKMSAWGVCDRNVIIAKRYIFVAHALFEDLPNYNPIFWRGEQDYVAVSKAASESFKRRFRINTEVISNYYPEEISSKRKKMQSHNFKLDRLNLVSATRLSEEKGWSRMVNLADRLDAANIKYSWKVFTNRPQSDNRFDFCEPKLDLNREIAAADYLVQLSDTEGFGYSAVEANSQHTPAIVTKWRGVNDVVAKENGVFLEMNMSNLAIEDLLTPKTVVRYDGEVINKELNRQWTKIWREAQHNEVLCRVVNPYKDIETRTSMVGGQYFFTSEKRFKYLKKLNFVRGVMI